MEAISVFDMLKIGVGPSSSHTLGPWRAVQRWLDEYMPRSADIVVEDIVVELYGSLALTGRGHATDKAVCLGLLGEDPVTIDVDRIDAMLDDLAESGELALPNGQPVAFDPLTQIRFRDNDSLPYHANGMILRATLDGEAVAATYYSTGGGFVARDDETETPPTPSVQLPFPCPSGESLLMHCIHDDASIAEIVRQNERAWQSDDDVRTGLRRIWHAMRDAIFRGTNTDGVLPGGLSVQRRAHRIARNLLYPDDPAMEFVGSADEWIDAIRAQTWDFHQMLRWISCFALAVNEENACMGRIVTAPTNGAAGVIPAVLMQHVCFAPDPVSESDIEDFLLVAGEIGSLFKKNATISAAEGGCQAEIGVSSAMAAAALTEVRGGSPGQAAMAAEIAMEHHLGMTCDPVAGLVQVPCIERNAMGATKAIQAAELALVSDPGMAKVSLDEVIAIMWETARDMDRRYKETSQGGLAVRIAVNIPEC